MTSASTTLFDPGDTGRRNPSEPPPPVERIGLLRWLRDNLFSSVPNAIISVLGTVALAVTVPRVVDWVLIDSVWYTDDSAACRAAAGACWAVIAEKHRVMFFGLYPFEEHWRPFLALLIYVGTLGVSAIPRFWRWKFLLPLWIVATTSIITLMFGGVLGMRALETNDWGGLPLTMVVFTGTMVIGSPIAVVLALGRRSDLPVVKTICVIFIEGVRAVPLVTVLFCAAVVFPLFFPPGITIDKLMRVVVAMGIFFGCFQAEVIRGGLQAIPRGQYEAANSLGLSYWQTTRKIILPQAIRIVIPGLMNHVISSFKNSTYVIIVGLFDILNATSASVADPNWIAYYTEAYLFVAFVYFLGAFALSRYGQFLERRFGEGRRY